ncbi:post-PEP-CTERM-1 domain-containing protein [Massilia sp. DD77]|uniref:post-PEP-CTERM-1 domain-containing protein n=1 Tax=Massilia sp. DD77 TaxID=3109349 RepID=UPI0030009A57
MRPSRLLFLLPLAACCAAAWAAPQAEHQAAGQEGMIVVRDPQTGQMRPPTAAELQALQRAAPAPRLAPFQPKMVLGADGRRSYPLLRDIGW